MLWSAFRTFTEPDEYDAAIRAATVNTVITGRGKNVSEWVRIDLNQLWMQSGTTSLSNVTHTVITSGRDTIYFLADRGDATVQHNGQDLPVAGLVALRSGDEYHRRAATGCSWASMSMAPDNLAAVAKALTGQEFIRPHANSIVRPHPDLMESLRRAHAAARLLAMNVPEVLEAPEVCKAMEQQLIHRMVGCLLSNTLVPRNSRHENRLPVMRRFEQIIRANQDSPLYIAEICAKVGVSERTLRAHCLEHLGIGPIHYLWLRRMHLARRALLQAEPLSATVTSIANDYGFGELGRFAVNYRLLFGESPSTTLAYPPNPRRKLRK